MPSKELVGMSSSDLCISNCQADITDPRDLMNGGTFYIYNKDKPFGLGAVENILKSLDPIAEDLKSRKFSPFLPYSFSMPVPMLGDKPSLLLHDLPECGKDGWTKAQELLSDNYDAALTTILGVSGSGKTHLCFETLCQKYGFYIVAAPSTYLGSSTRDLQTITEDLETMTLRYGSLKHTQEASIMAKHATKYVLLAQLLILHRLLSNCTMTPKEWLLFQLRPQNDVFRRLSWTLWQSTYRNEVLSNFTNIKDKILPKCHNLTGQNHLIVILDEAQVLLNKMKDFFLRESEPQSKIYRSLLSPVTTALVGSDSCRLFVCGSALSILHSEELLQSAIGKHEKSIRFTNLGVIDSEAFFIKHVLDFTKNQPAIQARASIDTALEQVQHQFLSDVEQSSFISKLTSLQSYKPQVLQVFKEASASTLLVGKAIIMKDRKDLELMTHGLAMMEKEEAAKKFFELANLESVYRTRMVMGILVSDQSGSGTTWEKLVPWHLWRVLFNGQIRVENHLLFKNLNIPNFKGPVSLHLPADKDNLPSATYGQVSTLKFTLSHYLDQVLLPTLTNP
ncbi:11414_t:CDS:2, partial [Paraglomus brasilianum]